MRYLQIIFLLLVFGLSHGQTLVSGTVKDYHSYENLPFVTIRADTLSYNYHLKRSLSLISPDTTLTNWAGEFKFSIKDSQLLDLTFSFVGYYTLTIKNIEIKAGNECIDIGDIYLPIKGRWLEG